MTKYTIRRSNKTRKNRRTRALTPPRRKKKTVKSNQSSYFNDIASFIFDPFLSKENQFKPKQPKKNKSKTPKKSRPYSYVKQSPPKARTPRQSRPYSYVKQSPPKAKTPRQSRPYSYVKQSPPKANTPRQSRPYSFKSKTQRKATPPKNKTQKKKTPTPKKKTPTPPKKKTPPSRDNSPSWSKGSIDHIKAYKILGLTNRYTKAELKKSYMKLARKYHPDKNLQNKEKAARKFKKVKAAFDLLNGAFM